MDNQEESDQKKVLQEALTSLLDKTDLEKVIGVAIPFATDQGATHPRCALMYVKFQEDRPLVEALARMLVAACPNYALSRRRRLAFRQKLKESAAGDLTLVPDIMRVVKEVFIEFRKLHPQRASELGEVLAYCIALQYLEAAQIAAKMSLKTSPNMPVHGLDGIHATFANDALTIYFLESKVSKTADAGILSYAKSVGSFTKDQKQYLKEYELIGDLSNLDTLEKEAREIALQHFDVMGKPDTPRRERYIGVICYSESKHFANVVPVTDKEIDKHEKHFKANYASESGKLQASATKKLLSKGANPNKCSMFFVAVPDTKLLREAFYDALGYPSQLRTK